MWVVAFMAALMLGTIMSTESELVETDSGDNAEDMDTAGDDGMTPDPVTPLMPDAADDLPDVDIEDSTDPEVGVTPEADPVIGPDPVTNTEPDTTPEPDPDAAPDPAPDPVDDPVVPGISVVNTGEETVFGSEGNDTLSADTFGPITISTSSTDIQLLGGDDIVEFGSGSLFTTNIDGGDGNDTLSGVVNTPLVLLGGAGDDILSSNSEGRLVGGDGNDTITSDITDIFDEQVVLSGGAGDDVLQVTTDISGDDLFAGQADLSGGEGADRFEVNLELSDTLPSADLVIGPDTFITILDFDPSEDVLQIEIIRPDGAEPREISSTSLNRDETREPFTDVDVSFAGTDTQEAVTTTFRVFSEEPFTLDDIVFVEAADPAAAVA